MKNKLKYRVGIALLLIGQGLAAQNTETTDTLYVKGLVRDAATERFIQGVKVDAGVFTALTDENGAYQIQVPFRSAELTFTLEGYRKRTVSLQGESEKNVALYSDNFDPAGERNYAISPSLTVDDEIQHRFNADVRSISRSGIPAIGSNLYIRGYNSLNINAQPLIVVDGTVWDNPHHKESIHAGYFLNAFAGIDVNDIESIQVIKDASSIYGSKGANGAILIETIKSRSEVTQIAFDALFGLNLAPNLPQVMNAGEFRSYAGELMKNMDNRNRTMSYEETFLNDDLSRPTYNKYHNDNRWDNDVYRTGTSQRYGINVQGGDDVAMYLISLGYTRGQGTVKESDFSRLNTRVNSDIKLGSRIKLSANIYFSYMDNRLHDDGSLNERTSPTFLSQVKSPFLIPYTYTVDGSRITNTLEDADDLFDVSNPVALLNNSIGKNAQYNFGISANFAWDILPALKFSNRFSYTLENLNEHYFSPMMGTSPIALEKGQWSENTIKDQTMNQVSLFNDSKLQFNRLFSRIHHLETALGARIYVNTFKSDYGEGHNSGDDKKINLSRSLQYFHTEGVNDRWNSVSLFFSAGYSYKNRYEAEFISTLDASSRFGTATADGFRMGGTTWALFPSGRLAWKVSSEPFMKALPFIDLLRLHVDYGRSGNDDIGNITRYPYLSPINYLGSATGLKIDNLANASLQWETTTKAGAGIDLSVWDERLSFFADVFKHQTADLLTLKQAPENSGLNHYWSNEGSLENTGYAGGFNVKIFNGKQFKWVFELTVSHYKNKITSLPDGDYTTVINEREAEILTSIGNPAGLFYGYRTHGIFTSDAESREVYNGIGLKKQNENASFSYFRGGDVHFDDRDNNGVIDKNDRQIIGDPNPDITGSIGNRFSMGRFLLDILFSYSLGNDVYNYQRSVLEEMTQFYNQSTAVTNRWKADGQQTSIPKATYGDPMGNARFSDRWIEDGSYLKLKDVRLTYSLPVQIPFIEGITVWIAGSNLYTWTKYLGSDPETSISSSVLYQGIDIGLLPKGRSFFLGLKLNL